MFIFSDADRTVEMETPALNETTLLTNEEEAFALEPVTITRRHKHTPVKPSFNSHMCKTKQFKRHQYKDLKLHTPRALYKHNQPKTVYAVFVWSHMSFVCI